MCESTTWRSEEPNCFVTFTCIYLQTTFLSIGNLVTVLSRKITDFWFSTQKFALLYPHLHALFTSLGTL